MCEKAGFHNATGYGTYIYRYILKSLHILKCHFFKGPKEI